MSVARLKIAVHEKDTGWAKFVANTRELIAAKAYVKVGVLDDGKGAEVRDGGLTNAQLAAVHEFGSSDGRIPERSFMRSTFEAGRAGYVAMLKTLIGQIVEGKQSIPRAFNLVGLKIASDMKARIVAGIAPPNAPSTIARKGSSTPLVDTGRLLGAISWLFVRGRE